ncbi:MAG TPA: NTF2 fold immunity protein [Longimicrobium sp.]|nr:NTF2 fold immunity protein [Longimicrobium sp.]
MPTPEVATQIAYAVLVPIYGVQQIEEQLPLTAQLDGDLWIVQGTLPQGRRGGVARIEISRRNGRISHLSHGR